MLDESDRVLHVPKRPVTVELALAGRVPVRAKVFVPRESSDRSVRTAVVELLEMEHPFLPTLREGEATPQIVNKDTLLWVAIDTGALEAQEGEPDDLFEYQHEVRVELIGNTTLAGELLYTLPADRARVVDYLNAPGRFFRLWSGGRLLLVNKAYVEHVIEAPLDLEAALSQPDQKE